MNKQIIVYILLGMAVGVVIVSIVLFAQVYKENTASSPKIKEDIAAVKQISSQETSYQIPANSFPPNNELENISKTKQQEQRALAEVLEKRRQIAAKVRAEVEASMNEQAVPASEEKQVEVTQSTQIQSIQAQSAQTQPTKAQSSQAKVAQPATIQDSKKQGSTVLPSSIRFGQSYIHH